MSSCVSIESCRTIAAKSGKAMPDVPIHSNIARPVAVFAAVQTRHFQQQSGATVFSLLSGAFPREGKESDMPDLLLELRSEEIPGPMQRKAAGDLRKLVRCFGGCRSDL